tara:strand:+ start:982 stop:1311 length:330 start_codon:yes stop_codon:yes gene_type:complete
MANECLVSEITEYKSPSSTRTVVVTRKNCSETGQRLEVLLSKLSDNSGEILLDFDVDKWGNIPFRVDVKWLGENDLSINLPKGYSHYTSQEQRAGVNVLYEHETVKITV